MKKIFCWRLRATKDEQYRIEHSPINKMVNLIFKNICLYAYDSAKQDTVKTTAYENVEVKIKCLKNVNIHSCFF